MSDDATAEKRHHRYLRARVDRQGEKAEKGWKQAQETRKQTDASEYSRFTAKGGP